MKTNFKRLGIAAAAAALSTTYAGYAAAQTRSAGNLGDLALVPYYTVQDNWATGVHIINSSPFTQVVKLRLRRGSDSADSLDFNLILSPKDEWTGSLSNDTGTVVLSTDDTSCTAPQRADGRFSMPAIFSIGAEEGYIEVIGMGQPQNEQMPIAINAKHGSGIPANCTNVASNFFANLSLLNPVRPNEKGNISNSLTNQSAAAGEASTLAGLGNTCRTTAGAPIGAGDVTLAGICENLYDSTDDEALTVSYFIRDAAVGTEFGGNAVHISGFSADPWLTNQETGLLSGDFFGFDFPDLDGGPWVGLNPFVLRGRYDPLRASDVLGSSAVINDWSIASARNVSTDWVVTIPGQYTMIDTLVYLTAGLSVDNCARPAIAATGQTALPVCDYRDIPVTADLTLYDREESVIVPESGDLVISPAPPGTTNTLVLPNEVNVIEWTNDSNTPVLGSAYATTVDPSVLGDSGWASLAVSSSTTKTGGQGICWFDPFTNNDNPPGGASNTPIWNTSGVRAGTCAPLVNTNVPMIGFIAWERSFPQNPEGNYGRLIDHSFQP
jgi:hypothetical protein